MSPENNKAIARRFVEEFFNKRNVDILDELFAPDVVEHQIGFADELRGRPAVKDLYTSFLNAFGDLHLELEDEIAEGDSVVQRFTTSGTHTGPLVSPGGTIPPTGKRATWAAIHIARITNGKMVEGWGLGDNIGMMQQLGIIPAPGQTGG